MLPYLMYTDLFFCEESEESLRGLLGKFYNYTHTYIHNFGKRKAMMVDEESLQCKMLNDR